MHDIARHVGVSRQLVSLVLRDLPGASDETRKRVRRAAAELGYSPNIAARTLRQASSKYLGVAFVPSHATEPDIVASIYPEALKRGYNVVLSAETSTRYNGQAVDELLGYRSEAIILIGAVETRVIEALVRRTSVPVVSVGAGVRNPLYDIVRSAGDLGIDSAVDHLAELGHTDIVYINSESMAPAPLRLLGYNGAMARLGLRPQVITVSGDYTEESGSIGARQLLAKGRLPTALVAANDQAAMGAMQVLLRAGLSIPDDISVTGYDDSRFARLSAVDLTTVRQDPTEMGQAAVDAALRRIVDPTLEPTEFVIDPQLVVRGSTAAPKR
jgi:DNA-binding LacI/PurR family transcriptional regulator